MFLYDFRTQRKFDEVSIINRISILRDRNPRHVKQLNSVLENGESLDRFKHRLGVRKSDTVKFRKGCLRWSRTLKNPSTKRDRGGTFKLENGTLWDLC